MPERQDMERQGIGHQGIGNQGIGRRNVAATRVGRRAGPGRRGRDALLAAAGALSGFALARLFARDPRAAPASGLASPDTAPWEALEGKELILPPAGHERTDVGFAPMLAAGVLLLLGVGGVLLLAQLLYPFAAPDRQPLSAVPSFPAPVLQTNTPADMAAFRDRQLRVLNGASWTDEAQGRVRMPIEDAMREVARRGIPDWPGAPADRGVAAAAAAAQR